ncbi:hypothetical protein ACHQM5_003937 [Ranunculus cassubicifolius]
MRFKKGDSVEISIKEAGFLGSYFVAKVLSRIQDGVYLIEYKTLLNDAETHLLRDIVDGVNVRPLPPEIPVSEFSLYDKVDVYDNDGWWEGIVTGRKGLMYHVYFESTREEIAYPMFRLRIHQDWVDEKWVLSSRKV